MPSSPVVRTPFSRPGLSHPPMDTVLSASRAVTKSHVTPSSVENWRAKETPDIGVPLVSTLVTVIEPTLGVFSRVTVITCPSCSTAAS